MKFCALYRQSWQKLSCVFLVLCLAVSVAGSPADSTDLDSLTVGAMKKFEFFFPPQELPSIEFTDGQEKPVSLADFKGRYVLLNFWAVWCPPCVKEMPSLNMLQTKYDPEKFKVIALSQDRYGKDVAPAFLNKRHLTALGVYLDPLKKVYNALKLPGIPVTYLINPDGKAVGVLYGTAEWDSEEAVQLIDFFLKRETPGDL